MARILIACGGTGGHFYPGLSLGQALKARGHEVVFLLRQGDPAFATLERLRLPSAEADVVGLPRKLAVDWASWAWRNFRGFRTVRNVVRSFRPDCVVGTGAYLTLPAATFARFRGIPVLIHESNARLGLANRLAARVASRVALGLPIEGVEAALTGTPIRPAFARLPSAASARKELGLEPGLRTLLIFGGSQGAEALNRLALGALRELSTRHPGKLQALHLAGQRHGDAVRAAASGLPVKVLDFLDKMELAFAAADLVLSRAGASTVAELIASRKPACLVPFPFATGDHQTDNAKVLQKAGAALLYKESELTEKGLANLLEPVILREPDRLRAMGEAYDGLPDPLNATEALSRLVEGLLQEVPTDAQRPASHLR